MSSSNDLSDSEPRTLPRTPHKKRPYKEAQCKSRNPKAQGSSSYSKSISSIRRGNPRKKMIRKKDDPRQALKDFVADEADEASEQSEEDDGMQEEQAEKMRERYRPKNNSYNDFLNRDAEQIARQYVERERIERTTKEETAHHVPTLKDPKLFAIRCIIGAEREMALSVGNKFSALKGTPEEIRIISVNALDKIQGYIYVEAINKFDAEHACKGFNKLKTQYINVSSTL